MGCAFRIQSVIDRVRTSTATNCSSKIGKSDLQVLTSTMKRNIYSLLHVSQGNQMFILKLFFSVCLSHVASTTERVHCWDQTFPHRNVHAHLSPRLVAGLQAVPYTHCEKFCQFHHVSRSSPVCSTSVLCHSVHIHSSNAHTLAQHCMQAYSTHRW